jgi:membrane protease YdiL (CAAX protease family)
MHVLAEPQPDLQLPPGATPPPSPSQPGWKRLIAKVLAIVFTEPWARIDARDKAPMVGRLTARQATLVTGLSAAVLLVVLRFVVMDHEVQSGIAALIIQLGGTVSKSLGETLQHYQRLLVNLSWVIGCFTCYFCVPALIIRHVFGLRLTDFYLTPREYLRHLPLYALLFLPVGLSVLGVAHSPEFQAQYPFYQEHQGTADLLVWEMGYAIQFFSLEFFFRGFLLRGMAAELGAMAMMVMMIPYCMIHFGKPLPECLGSIVAGMVLGTLAMDTRSIWGGVTIHVAVAWSMDLASLWHKGQL